MSARDRVGPTALALMFALAFALPVARVAVAQETRDRILPGCGICYPGGYDLNTDGSVQGRLLEIQVPEEGPVRLVMASDAERWIVLASPAWFWKLADQPLAAGGIVTVRGSKTLGADGTLYIVAREIQPQGGGPVIIVRDRLGAPLWRGSHRGGGMPGGASAPGNAQGMGRGRNGGGRR